MLPTREQARALLEWGNCGTNIYNLFREGISKGIFI